MNEFFKELVKKRKVAIRRGEELETQDGYRLKQPLLKKLLNGNIELDGLKPEDFSLDLTQKGVDMRLGLDIATLSSSRIVNQIIMISGDSDFVPAAKHARRSGIDFVLDPMWGRVTDSLFEHIDGLEQSVARPPGNLKDPLHVDNLKGATNQTRGKQRDV